MNERDKIFIHIPSNLYSSNGKGKQLRWSNNIGKTILIIKDNINYDILIKDVNIEKESIIFSYNDRNIEMSFARFEQILEQQFNEGFCNGGKLIYLIDRHTLLGENGYNAVIHFNYKIGERILDKNIDYIITGFFTKPDRSSMKKMYNIHCNICGWDGIISEQSIRNHERCSCCCNTVVVPGINDIATTDPWSIPYFINKEDIYKYHKGASYHVDMICPFCKTVYPNIVIRNFFINTHHLDCPCNSSYKSYAERFIFNLFKQLNLRIITQVNSSIFTWCKKYKYDFYLPDYDTIVEVNGIQHYNGSFERLSKRTLLDEQENDINKALLAIKNNISHYIILDCRYSNLNYIKYNVMSSALPYIIGFEEKDIDWDECDLKATNNLIKEVCDLYMNNEDLNKYDFAEHFGVKPLTILTYLKRGCSLGFCDYDPYSKKGLKFGRKTK